MSSGENGCEPTYEELKLGKRYTNPCGE
ncbi:hypothetical protein TAGGR_2407 [Thermodesulfovibrio aggregans]|uniref:Uncharacterized protein n=1 Tax=Thermodesulfovibrio aggregans TaxID=86166 RepID=A0A0U9HR55_9BACT|nr:hypothetical protein TAGGR_2407 [Thermodesulfovibrio aggregans]